MVNAFGKKGQTRHKFFFVNISYFQRAAFAVDIAPRKLRHFAHNSAAVIRKAGTGIKCFECFLAAAAPRKRVNDKSFKAFRYYGRTCYFRRFAVKNYNFAKVIRTFCRLYIRIFFGFLRRKPLADSIAGYHVVFYKILIAKFF